MAMKTSLVILENARRIGLNVRLDGDTPPNGDCWYISIIQQLQRPDIIPEIDNEEIKSLATSCDILHSAIRLRKMVSDFVIKSAEDGSSYVINLFKETVLQADAVKWDDFVLQQSTQYTYAQDIFLQATACVIGIKIHVTSTHSKRRS